MFHRTIQKFVTKKSLIFYIEPHTPAIVLHTIFYTIFALLLEDFGILQCRIECENLKSLKSNLK